MLEVVINAEHSALDIDDANQKVDTTGAMAGLLAPKLLEVYGASLSAKALLGFGQHTGDRKVLTNSQSYSGSQQVSASYASGYGVLGGALTKSHAFSERFRAVALMGSDLVIQRVGSYTESAYFAWDTRTIAQLQSRIEAGLEHGFHNNAATVFGRAGVENRTLVAGQSQNYRISGTAVSFDGTKANDTYLTGHVGVTGQLGKATLFGGVIAKASVDTVRSLQAYAGIRAAF